MKKVKLPDTDRITFILRVDDKNGKQKTIGLKDMIGQRHEIVGPSNSIFKVTMYFKIHPFEDLKQVKKFLSGENLAKDSGFASIE